MPEHLYRAELRYEHAAGWFVAPSLEWAASGSWIDYANSRKAPSYAILNLGVGWRLTRQVSVFADARNLTNETYVSNVQAATVWTPAAALIWPGDGRALFAGLTLAF